MGDPTALLFLALGVVVGGILPVIGLVIDLVVIGILASAGIVFLLVWVVRGMRTRGLLVCALAFSIGFVLPLAVWFVLTTRDILQITFLSLYVTGTSTLVSTAIAVPLGIALGLHEVGGQRLVRNILFTLYGLPPVLAGLLVFLLLSRGGPLGFLGLLFTPLGMVIAQVVVVTPIILGITTSVVSTVERRVKETAHVLGADRRQLAATVMHEAAAGVLTAVMVGFGRAISEVGAVFIVGGHIQGQTQVLTTTIITDVQQAAYAHAVGLGAILLVLGGIVYALLFRLQERTLP